MYSHATFTVRAHHFVPLDEPGGLILLDVATVRPLDIYVQLRADFDLAWPGSFGGQYIPWDAANRHFLLFRGGVRLYNPVVGSPFAVEGTSHPAHDAPTIPSRFRLTFEPGRTATEFIPIAFAASVEARDSAYAPYQRLLRNARRYWEAKVAHYDSLRTRRLSIATPEPAFDLALEWAKVNLDQTLACNPDLGCGMVAGFGVAGHGSFRPGFAWYFGGDAAINSFAMDLLGQHELVRQGLGFFARYQREDGKIAHEISHAAGRLPWFDRHPYTWFHGDTTPFWLRAVLAYWLACADTAFVRDEWARIRKAYEWCRSTDTDGDGLMEHPSAGAGAIEVGGLGEALWSDIYLSGVWVAALSAMRALATAMDDDALAANADATYRRARESLKTRFWLPGAGGYLIELEGRAGTPWTLRFRAPRRPRAVTGGALTMFDERGLGTMEGRFATGPGQWTRARVVVR